MEFTPLAERLRPKTLDEYIGQDHLVDENASFRKALQKGLLPSIILWGPPGVGKTTLARIIANTLNRPFYTLSAINSGVKDVRDVISKVENSGLFGSGNAVLFIDEIHRFSKSQQDSLLGAVEKGTITLIGATTENPSFEVNSALLSRCQVHVLKPMSKDNLLVLLRRALKSDRELSARKMELKEFDALIKISGGDARRLLNTLESVVQTMAENEQIITNKRVTEIIQENPSLYDKDGEQHYDIISAFIKSIRGTDPNAAVYWLARMLKGGEDPKFIARRLIILASEDIGNANPTALVIANTCFETVHKIGMPESRIILSQCAVYLASSPKSNASYEAIGKAYSEVEKSGNLAVPMHLRNAPTQLMRELDYGKNYKYAHSYENNFEDQEYLPDEISGMKFFEPGANNRESEMRKRLQKLWRDKYNY